MDVAGWPFDTGGGPKKPYKLFTLFQVLFEQKFSAETRTICVAACRDCRATPGEQIMISLLPPPYLEKGKYVDNQTTQPLRLAGT